MTAAMQDDDLAARFAAFRRRTDNGAEIAAARRRVEAIWRHPRDAAAAMDYHRDRLPAGRYWIAGAGPQGADLAQALTRRGDLTIAGFVDRKAHLFPDGCEGLPVVSAAIDDAPIIVANRAWESDMFDDLVEAGIAPDRLVRTYTAETFAAAAPPDPPPAREPGSVRTLVVRDSSRIGLLSEATLRPLLPADDTLVVYTSSHLHHERSDFYCWTDADLSVGRILRLIERLRPETVILATMPQFNDLALPLCPADRTWRFVFEPNDITLIYGEALRELAPMSRAHLDRCRLAEAWALRHADMTITNCMGPRWEGLLEALGGRARPFFFGADIRAANAAATDGPIRILYAGGIPQAYLRAAWETDYRFLPLLADLARHDGIAVDVFNAYHTHPNQDDRYADVMAWQESGLRYSRAQPFDRILASASYSFGWLHRGDIPRRPKGKTGAGNDVLVLNKRFTAYLAAGLPIIIDDQLDAMADLVERFGAGIVLPVGPLDTGEVVARLASADRAALAAGAARLHRHIATANKDTLAAVAALLHGPKGA